MLDAIGVDTVDALFDEIDDRLRGADISAIPPGENEMAMLAELAGARPRRRDRAVFPRRRLLRPSHPRGGFGISPAAASSSPPTRPTKPRPAKAPCR